MLTFQTLFYNILSVAIVDERFYYYFNDSIVINIIYHVFNNTAIHFTTVVE